MSGDTSLISRFQSPSLSILMAEVLKINRPIPDPDSSIQISVEKERCEKFNKVFHYIDEQNRTQRRRIFAGGLIADDSWHVIGAHALESYGIFHSITFFESNRTQSFEPRSLRFVPDASVDRKLLQSGIFGPDTPVYIENFVLETKTMPMLREHLMRGAVLKKWKELGMTREDIGLIMDVDEIVSRDFLRAAQICELMDEKERMNFWDTSDRQTCRDPLVRLNVPMMEGSPKCIYKGKGQLKFKRFSSLSMVIGACIEGIGDAQRHPPTKRSHEIEGKPVGSRVKGYGTQFDYSLIPNGVNGYYPLYSSTDFRQMMGSSNIYGGVGYHLHNFFDSAERIRFKYAYFGHIHKHAYDVPLGAMNADMNLLLKCAHELPDEGNRKQRVENGLKELEKESGLPLALQLKGYVEARHKETVRMLEKDEEEYGRADNFDGHHLYNEGRDLTHKGRKHGHIDQRVTTIEAK
eukprot:CAMPEP_0204618206 /NCGR_PEP_ID=MMETSP0717-20131115/4938_1 /ASSEMBLY_ACC=CAM_ASM_000666 /TAXON_ID=230516 /ORGANISM="Chaetoceros curvisetus" /LENGTH=463 /DNA_ID=CAMNT_0051631897 /DNA_START=24 /DNA_END=1415 /DNA_ORIENTATION=+